ncbi:MAG TPA: phosphoribosyltransferase family protein [Spongiibacteraceae bacterium]|nr:phosphoribosyltransferase family protein [Spongiibacteraceae bacterium]
MRDFENRAAAGRRLAAELVDRHLVKPVVIALARGGVPVAYEIARTLQAPLQVLLVRKIGAPIQPEFAIGAIADGDPPHTVFDSDSIALLNVPDSYLATETARQIAEIERRRISYGIAATAQPLAGCTAILVDDGIATGATTRAALEALHARHPAQIVLAVPVAATATIAQLRAEVDEVVCLLSTDYFSSIGGFYRDFTQVDDAVVVDFLRRAPSVESSFLPSPPPEHRLR